MNYRRVEDCNNCINSKKDLCSNRECTLINDIDKYVGVGHICDKYEKWVAK